MKQIAILPYVLLLILLTGCLAGGEIREQNFEAINQADWPAPEPTATLVPTRAVIEIELPTATPVVERSASSAIVDRPSSATTGELNIARLIGHRVPHCRGSRDKGNDLNRATGAG